MITGIELTKVAVTVAIAPAVLGFDAVSMIFAPLAICEQVLVTRLVVRLRCIKTRLTPLRRNNVLQTRSIVLFGQLKTHPIFLLASDRISTLVLDSTIGRPSFLVRCRRPLLKPPVVPFARARFATPGSRAARAIATIPPRGENPCHPTKENNYARVPPQAPQKRPLTSAYTKNARLSHPSNRTA